MRAQVINGSGWGLPLVLEYERGVELARTFLTLSTSVTFYSSMCCLFHRTSLRRLLIIYSLFFNLSTSKKGFIWYTVLYKITVSLVSK